jgi:DNA mismatch endonuclease (patch repair protein)
MGTKEYRPKSPEEIARNMSAIRSTDNRTETALRKALHRMGLRYRKYAKGMLGKPDLIFPTERIAVFVDGDYWHGRKVREEGIGAFNAQLRTTNNRTYWMEKMERNITRDDYVTTTLEQSGWLVLRYWESDVKKDVASYASRIAGIVRERRASLVQHTSG